MENAYKNASKSEKKFKIKIDDDRKGQPIEINTKTSEVVIRPRSKPFKSFKKKEKILLQELLLIFETAYKEAKNKGEGIDDLKRYFYEALEKRER